MPLTIEELRSLAREACENGLAAGPVVPADDVLPHMESDDRNVRVAALRVLAWSEDPQAVEGILRGLDDPVKRVREVAAKSSPRFAPDPRIRARLQQAVEQDERGSARPAMEILGGMYSSNYGLRATETVDRALATLADLPKYRQRVLGSLLRTPRLSDDAEVILRSFVADGSKQEAVLATRRLCGFRLARRETLDDEARLTAEPAWGHVWVWLRD